MKTFWLELPQILLAYSLALFNWQIPELLIREKRKSLA